MQDFLEKAMLLTPSARDTLAAFDLVRRARSQLTRAQSKAQLDIRNVESVFSAFEMAELFGQLGDLSQAEIERLMPSMRRVIVHTVEHYMDVPMYQGKIHPPHIYQRFGALLSALLAADHDVSVMTFNYDVGVDMGLWLNRIEADYCLETVEDPSSRGLELMKLHGSLNWAFCPPPCGTVVPYSVGEAVEEAERHGERSAVQKGRRSCTWHLTSIHAAVPSVTACAGKNR